MAITSTTRRALRSVRLALLPWCRRPLLAGAAAGLLGGLASGALTWLLMPESLAALGAAAGTPGLGWVVHLLLSAAAGAGVGHLARPWVGDARRALATGAGCGLAWWALGPAVLASAWPGWRALLDGEPAAGLIDLGCHLAYGTVLAGALWGGDAWLSAAAGHRLLEVYVAGHCLTCAEALRLAAAAAAHFPDLEVRVVDLDDGGGADGTGAFACATGVSRLPDGVIAVPTYLLDGAVIWLGNPSPDALFARIRASLLVDASDSAPPAASQRR